MAARARRARSSDETPELGISTEKVCSLIEILREYAGRELPTATRDVSPGVIVTLDHPVRVFDGDKITVDRPGHWVVEKFSA